MSSWPPPDLTEQIIAGRPQLETASAQLPLRRALRTVLIDGRIVHLTPRAGGFGERDNLELSGNRHKIDLGSENVVLMLMPTSASSRQLPSLSTTVLSPTRDDIKLSWHSPESGRAILVLNDNYDAGWQATANNGRVLPHILADGFGNGFIVDSRDHELQLRYAPETLLRMGRLISILALLFGMVAVIWCAIFASLLSRSSRS